MPNDMSPLSLTTPKDSLTEASLKKGKHFVYSYSRIISVQRTDLV